MKSKQEYTDNQASNPSTLLTFEEKRKIFCDAIQKQPYYPLTELNFPDLIEILIQELTKAPKDRDDYLIRTCVETLDNAYNTVRKSTNDDEKYNLIALSRFDLIYPLREQEDNSKKSDTLTVTERIRLCCVLYDTFFEPTTKLNILRIADLMVESLMKNPEDTNSEDMNAYLTTLNHAFSVINQEKSESARLYKVMKTDFDLPNYTDANQRDLGMSLINKLISTNEISLSDYCETLFKALFKILGANYEIVEIYSDFASMYYDALALKEEEIIQQLVEIKKAVDEELDKSEEEMDCDLLEIMIGILNLVYYGTNEFEEPDIDYIGNAITEMQKEKA